LIAAFLLAQIEDTDRITSERLKRWARYHEAFQPLERAGTVRRPRIPAGALHNGHIYYLLLWDGSRQGPVLAALDRTGVGASSHYVPLHGTPAGLRFGRTAGSLAVTERIARSLIRLPIHSSMTEQDQGYVIDAVLRALED
jgi:dTDP-4-amino-4,6-dideoxygalactose transaminase